MANTLVNFTHKFRLISGFFQLFFFIIGWSVFQPQFNCSNKSRAIFNANVHTFGPQSTLISIGTKPTTDQL